MPEAVVCYFCVVELDGARTFFQWESGPGSPDRVVLDERGCIVAFATDEAARAAAVAAGGPVSEEPTAPYDLDAIEAWCHASGEPPDCQEVLNAWNLFTDLPRSNLFAAADRKANDVYDKLFAGCNLPAVTPPGEHYVPEWTESELAMLKQVIVLGLAEMRARLKG